MVRKDAGKSLCILNRTDMSLQIVSLLALVAVAYAAPGNLVSYAAAPAVYSVPTAVAVPQTVAVTGTNSREVIRSQDGFGNYASTYAVSDALTGDHKSSSEHGGPGYRVGAVSQLDPNGYERRTDYVSDAFGTRQHIQGSEYGLYVNAGAHTISPHGVPAVAAVAAPAYHAPIAHAAYGAHGYGALGYGAYGAHGYGALGYGAYGAHGYGALGHAYGAYGLHGAIY